MSVESLPPEPEEAYVIHEASNDDLIEKAAKVFLTEDQTRDYLRAIGKFPLLNAVQEVELSKRIEVGLYAAHLLQLESEGDKTVTRRSVKTYWSDLATLAEQGEQAKEQFYCSNLRLVVSIAKRYTGRGVPFMDLVQDGNLGLRHAIELFDYRKGYKFSTYGTNWIRQAITREMANTASVIRKPVYMVEKIKKCGATERDLLMKLGREPTEVEVAEAMNMSVDDIRAIKSYGREPISLNKPVGANGMDDAMEYGELLPDISTVAPEESTSLQLRKEAINDVLANLSQQEQIVIRLRYGLDGSEPQTLEQIGQVIGKTRERARVVQNNALRRLLAYAHIAGLKDYLIEP